MLAIHAWMSFLSIMECDQVDQAEGVNNCERGCLTSATSTVLSTQVSTLDYWLDYLASGQWCEDQICRPGVNGI